MQRLLAPDGCPWDREQTLASLRPFVIEEAHEVVDAIDRGDHADLREELGDLLLQIVFQSELGRRAGTFAIDDVVLAISQKMVERHPHVFARATARTADDVLDGWEKQKAREREAKASSEPPKGALDGVPVAMPALLRAVRIGEKAGRVGYDWPSAEGARAKVDEELAELDEAIRAGARERMSEELGDLLFAIASWARLAAIDPEASLRETLDRFTTRFRAAEALARERGGSLDRLTPRERDALWDEVKRASR